MSRNVRADRPHRDAASINAVRPHLPLARAATDWKPFLPRERLILDCELSMLVDSFLEELRRQSSPASSQRTARSMLRGFARDFPIQHVSAISREALIAWTLARKSIGGRGNANKTIRRDLSVLRRMLVHACEIGVLAANPLASPFPRGVVPPNRVRDRSRAALEVLSLEEAARMIRSELIPFERRLLWATLLFTGVRIGEAAALRWSDYHPDRTPLGELVVQRSYDSASKTTRATKTDLVRHVPVAGELAGLFAELGARRPRDLMIPYTVPRTCGAQHAWDAEVARAWFRKDLARLGIESPASGPRRTHCTRHTFTSLAARAGANPLAIEEITHNPDAAHRSDRSSFRVYVHLTWSELCAAVSAIKLPEGSR